MSILRNAYMKNKSKYVELNEHYHDGGGKKKKTRKLHRESTVVKKEEDFGDELVNFIETASKEKIEKNTIDLLRNNQVCDKIIGEGFAGRAKISSVGPMHIFDPAQNGNLIVIPIVIKDTFTDKPVNFWNNDGTLYAYSHGGVAIESIILYYVRNLIKQKKSPHLPLIINHSACNPELPQSVDRIITERHGLDRLLNVKINGFYEGPMWHEVRDYDPRNPTYPTRMATFDDLMIYTNLTKNLNDDMITLPNDEKCDLIELIDYLTISYIVTCDLLINNNIYLLDMHPQNIFIHWLGQDSYLHDQYIGDTKHIFYKRKDKYYKIKTFGLLLKIGDVGASIIKPQKNVLFVGQANNIEKTHHIADFIVGNPTCFDFPLTYRMTMSFDTLRKTCANKILESHPYDKLYWMSQDKSLLKDRFKTDQLLQYFDKYSVDKIDETDNYLII